MIQKQWFSRILDDSEKWGKSLEDNEKEKERRNWRLFVHC
jgi:hypothetical protein